MKRWMGIVAAFLLVAGAKLFAMGEGAQFGEAAMALGFVLIVSYVVGRGASGLGLPSITGYMLVGMFFGPQLLSHVHVGLVILDEKSVSRLQLLDSLALGLIALSAGGELKWEVMREHWKRILGVLAGQAFFVPAGVFLMVLFLRDWIPLLSEMSQPHLIAAGLLFSGAALANSPSTALAIIQEYRARGPVSEVVLSVTVAKDVVVISLFTVLLSIALVMVGGGAEDGNPYLILAWEVFGSIFAGIALGLLVSGFMRRVHRDAPVIILVVAFAAMSLLPQWHLSGLLACMVAGFYIENFSPHGDDLIRAIERHSMPVYVVFFTIAGASLDLEALSRTWPLALSLALLRIFLTAAGTSLGALVTSAPTTLIQFGWSGFVAQAGVTLGFAQIIEARFPDIGGTIKTVLLAMIAINQIVGPLLFRAGLSLSGEIGDRESGSAQERKAAKEVE